jgi:hypothetical protein
MFLSRRRSHVGDTTAVCGNVRTSVFLSKGVIDTTDVNLNGSSHQKRESVTSMTALVVRMSRTFVGTTGAPGQRRQSDRRESNARIISSPS